MMHSIEFDVDTSERDTIEAAAFLLGESKEEFVCIAALDRAERFYTERHAEEVEKLREIIANSWDTAKGICVKDNAVDGFVTVDLVVGAETRHSRDIAVITRGPSGQHYKWVYIEAANENSRYIGPTFRGGIVNLIPVCKTEKVVTVTEWTESPT